MIEEKHQKWIRKKFPIFYTIKVNFEDQFTPTQLESLETDLVANRQQVLSKKNQKTLKKLKKLANESEKIYKSNKELYNLLSTLNQEQINQITLGHKKIQCLKPLQKRKFLKLSQIDLSFNSIKDIFPLTTSDLPSIRYFNLTKNDIKSLKGLHYCQWSNLKVINLNHNQITSIEPLSNAQFVSLQKLDLSDNQIVQIQSFHKSSSWQLKIANFKNNKLGSLRNIGRFYFIKLSQLNLRDNPISNSVDIEKFQMTSLKNKKSQNDKKYATQKPDEFIQYCCKLFYSQVIQKYKKEDLLLDFFQEKISKNSVKCSKHYRYAIIEAYVQQIAPKIPIITTRKLDLD